MTKLMEIKNLSHWNDTGYNQTATTEGFPISIAAFFAILSGYDVVVNFMVLAIFLGSKKLRDNDLYSLVLCLSLSDLAYGISGIIGGCRVMIRELWAHYELCTVHIIMVYSSLTMSFTQTLMISLHRYLLTSNTWYTHLLRGKRKYIAYLIGSLLTVTWFASWIKSNNNSSSLCDNEVVFGKDLIFVNLSFSVVNITLFVSTLVLYLLTLHRIKTRYRRTFAWQMEENRKSNRPVDKSTQSPLSTDYGKKRIFENLKTVGIIIVFLMLLSGPVVVLILISAIRKQTTTRIRLAVLMCCIWAMVRSSISPLIYCWKIQEFRHKITKTCSTSVRAAE